MAIRDESLGDLSLNNDIRPEIGINANQDNVSLGNNNAGLFAAVSDGDTTTGRSMSEMGGESITPAFFPTTEATGALGESLTFESSDNQKVERQLSIEGSATTATISCWLKRHESNSGREIIYFSTDITGGNQWIFGFEFQNDYLLVFPQITYNTDADSYSETNFKFNDFGSWYHIVIAMDSTREAAIDRLKIYVNGDELNIDDFTYFNAPNKNTANISQVNHYQAIGDRWLQGSRNINSTIGDFKYIDGKQLRAGYFGEMKNGIWVPKAFNTASTDTLVTSGLVANYQLNGDATDETGNHNATSSSNITYYNNNYGIASFNGSNSTIIKRDIFSSSPTQCSLCVWAAATDWTPSSSNMTIAELGDPNTNIAQNRIFISTGGELYVSINGGDSGYASTNISNLINNAWHHIVATWDVSGGGVTNGVKLYIDGNLVQQGDSTASFNSLTDLAIGVNENTPDRHWFNGKIGEVQVYSDLLTAAEVLQNYNATKHKYTYGLNGFWLPLNNTSTGSIDSSSNLKLHLDASNSSSYSGSGTDWLDLTSNSNDATLSGSPSYLSSTNGGVFNFDNSNDYAIIEDSTSNVFGFANHIGTIEAWINVDSLSTNNVIASKRDFGNPGNRHWIFDVQTSGQIRFLVYNTDSNSQSVLSNSSISANKWYHIVASLSKSNIKIYINGIEDINATPSYSTIQNGGADLQIGRRGKNTSYEYFDGKFAQVRVYNETLTAQEVITNYRATQGNYEQVSTVDISGNANSHTPTSLNYTNHYADTPSDNYATLNPLAESSGGSYSNGNLKVTSQQDSTTATIAVDSGKWYAEATMSSITNAYVVIFGADGINPNMSGGWGSVGAIAYKQNGDQYSLPKGGSSSTTSYGASYTSGDVIGIALDLDSTPNTITFYKNGVSQGATTNGPTYIGSNQYTFGFYAGTQSATGTTTFNFGQREFSYTPPTGFKALSTSNLPNAQFDPKDSEQNKDYFKAVKYTGNGADGPKPGPWYITAGDAGGANTKFTGRFTQSDCTYTAPAGFSYWGGSWDPNNKQGTLTFTNSNKTVEEPGGGFYVQTATTNSYSSGKYYMELVMHQIEVVVSFNNDPSQTPFTTAFHDNTLQFRNWSGVYDFSNTQISSTTFAVNDIIGIAANIDDGEFSFYKNNTLVATNKFSLGNKIATGFKPDLVWIKNRDAAVEHRLHDSVRGQYKYLIPNATTQEQTSAANLASFYTNGFSVSGNGNAYNQKGVDYIAWCWKAGDTTVTDTTTGLSTEYRANQDAGFSIIKHSQATASGQYVPHGLSKAPELTIHKSIVSSAWGVFVPSILGDKYLYLHSDSSGNTNSTYTYTVDNTKFTTPTSTYYFGGGLGDNIIYAFHSVDGFSKIGSYTGNAVIDGPFVYTGFKPAFIMTKSTSTGVWVIKDNVRDTKNPVVKRLRANDGAYYESSDGADIDFLSNGFKISTGSNEVNASQTYIYIAFAEDPLTTSNSVANFGDGNEFIEGGNYPEDNFSTTLYTGNDPGSNSVSQKITGVGFAPDLVWIKNRDYTNNHVLVDSVRGDAKVIRTSSVNAESSTQYVQILLEEDGFTTGTGDDTNKGASGYNSFVAWCFKAAGKENTYNVLEDGVTTSSSSASTLGLNTGTSNPTGISANKDNGFSIIKYTGTGSAMSFSHGLNQAPEIIFFKALNANEDWLVFTSLVNNRWDYIFDGAGGLGANTLTQWTASDLPDSNNINFGASSGVINNTNGTQQMIAYAWHSVPGFSKMGTYTGKGSTAAMNIHLGFEPGLVIIKRTDSANNWVMFDNKRDSSTANLSQVLWADLVDSENNGQSTTSINLTKDGFNFTTSNYGGSINTNGGTYIYMAFAHR